MSLKNLVKALLPAKNLRYYSSSKKLVDIAINEKSGIATVTMQRLPVNSLNLELLTDLSSAFDDIDGKVKGMILTSASDKVFSAGLDIMEMYKPDKERVRAFWTALQNTWLKLYGSSYPTVAVINGHSPAGGCLLSMSCEYRIMLNNFTIGLNETQLGIVAPNWFMATIRNTISRRDSELALTSGKLFTTEEALKIGMVDEIAVDKNEGLAKADKFFQRFAKVHPLARQFTKTALRSQDLQDLMDNQEEDVQKFCYFVEQPKVQKSLEMYIQALKNKAK